MTDPPPGNWTIIIACDVAYAEGGDRRVIGSLIPGLHRVKSVKRGTDTTALMACAAELWAYAQAMHKQYDRPVEIRVDVGGPGAGTCGRLRELMTGCSWCRLVEFGFGDHETTDPNYENRGSEAFGDTRDLVDAGNTSFDCTAEDGVDYSRDYEDELTSRRWKTAAQKLTAEPKVEWRKSRHRHNSPDCGDETVMACWRGEQEIIPAHTEHRYYDEQEFPRTEIDAG